MFKVALHSVFDARRICTNGASARVFDTLHAFQTVNFFYNWHMDRLFPSLTVKKKSSHFKHILMHYASDFLVASGLSSGSSLSLTLVSKCLKVNMGLCATLMF